ncbi:hypothetical protein P353_06845 [Comamonas testosteroni]|uniref:Uncharacterized protein n=1 Tax=Comamonas testosteroni TaxID=285 RepID=A0A096H1E8_COMTE|nr:hypothetical protein P353_06845 [Comamonas testosteroni]
MLIGRISLDNLKFTLNIKTFSVFRKFILQFLPENRRL